MYLFERLQIYDLWTVKYEWKWLKVWVFNANLLKKQKPYPRFNERYGFQIELKICFVSKTAIYNDCILRSFDVYLAMF